MKQIIIFNINMERLAYLENATKIGYTLTLNAINYARFTLPIDDPKNQYCNVNNFVEVWVDNKRLDLFRIVNVNLNRPNNIEYECEHVITTLIDNVLFMFHEIGNVGTYTNAVLDYILNKQTTKRWKLGACDFKHQFLYKWENENLLTALFSVPKPFLDKYMWTYDTTQTPWVLNLKRIDAKSQIEAELRYKKNMQSVQKKVDATNILTRIYPLGYGEADNQLNIAKINGGKPYIEADAAAVKEYGIKESIWVDRRYENVESLKATAESMLNELKTPFFSYSVNALDLFKITKDNFDELKPGKLVRVIDKEDNININAFIISVDKPDVSQPAINVVIANKDKDIAGSISDLAERTRINELYAQGAANLLTMNFLDNADAENPAIFEFYLPADMVNINQALLRIKLLPFRGYSKAIKGGGKVEQSTEDGGADLLTSENGGADLLTSENGGADLHTSEEGGYTSTSTKNKSAVNTSTKNKEEVNRSTGNKEQIVTSTDNNVVLGTTDTQQDISTTSGGWNSDVTEWEVYSQKPTSMASPDLHVHQIFIKTQGWAHSHSINPHTHKFSLPEHTHKFTIPQHDHTFTIPQHDHQFTIPEHDHAFEVKAHKHDLRLPHHKHDLRIPHHKHDLRVPNHKHQIKIPDHVHGIEFGIFRGTTAKTITLKIDDKTVATTNLDNIDIAKFLKVDGGGKITRNAWHKIEIIPDALTRISANLYLNIFTNPRTNLNL